MLDASRYAAVVEGLVELYCSHFHRLGVISLEVRFEAAEADGRRFLILPRGI